MKKMGRALRAGLASRSGRDARHVRGVQRLRDVPSRSGAGFGGQGDQNGNGVADPEEVQLFGTGERIECASCHREHGDAPPPARPHMYLRVAADLLCLVCHRV